MNNNSPIMRSLFFKSLDSSWRDTVFELLKSCKIDIALKNEKRVLLKPNLVEALEPPITTPLPLLEAIVDYIREHLPGIEIVIGEGCGSLAYETDYPFEMLGYADLSKRKKIKLMDLNKASLIKLTNPALSRWPEIWLPRIAFESFIISVPVLKAHTLSGVTLTMKNMMGLAPPSHYQMNGHWKKASFHERIHESILDLNRYRKPDFSILDATVGMKESHLRGPTCNPPPNILVAGYDAVAIDAYGTGILNRDWRVIDHIRLADGELGYAKPLRLLQK